MSQRLRTQDLRNWKQKPRRKPLLLDGARQVGKTYLITQLFGPEEFNNVHHLDFRVHPELAELFQETLDPYTVLSNIELYLETKIDLHHDLIFFDEIGECQSALDSLKYFSTEMPHAYICASGSNIGLLKSFPVGAVSFLELFPLCFEEFLMASHNGLLLEVFRERRESQFIFKKLFATLLDYYFVGGMPEAVAEWFDDSNSLHERVENVKRVHEEIISGYQLDFGKYCGRIHPSQIDAVFSAIPRQLATNDNLSVQRFKFNDIVERKKRYVNFLKPIDWLEKSKLVRKCYPITGRPYHPLQIKLRVNMFKLFFFDVGLLCHMLGLSYLSQIKQDFQFKGFIAENFVQTELSARSIYPTFSWQQNQAEIEFLHTSTDGEIIPVEVKSGGRTRARSLPSYISRYNPSRAIILASKVGAKGAKPVETWPLYEAQFLAEL